MSAEQNPRGAVKDEGAAVKAVEKVIAEHLFLRGLKPAQLRRLADSALRMHYESGELIFREGDPANRFYLIEQGRVSLESHRRDEGPVAVQVIGPGDVLGWSWLFPPYYWHFDARALEPTTAIFFYGTRLREQCEQDHDFGYEMMKRMTHVVIHRLQATRKQLLKARP
jgi:CRP-like cAMP-binding protein